MTDPDPGLNWKSKVPEPVFDREPAWVDFYWKAWEIARDHIKTRDGVPQSPYMDEAFLDKYIWIWDTCFMSLFCRYAPGVFPGVESLLNFYAVMHDNAPSTLIVHHPDNPPLFAWVEQEYFRFTADTKRLRWLLGEKRYLQKHFDLFESFRPGPPPAYGFDKAPIACGRQADGYRWNGNSSGMDNTPRGRGDYGAVLWVDALAQQALAARSIAGLAEVVGDAAAVRRFSAEYEERKRLLNAHYWDEDDGIYYDIRADTKEPCKVKTPAAYWALLAGCASSAQAERMRELAVDPGVFGGAAPFPSVSRDDPDYDTGGKYWRGGVWLPTAYMAIRGLQAYGFLDTCAALSEALLAHMHKTYRNFEPHTIWEVYGPELPTPATTKRAWGLAKPDFCGWSALGPIALFLEHVIGFHTVDASARRVSWRKRQPGRHGVRRLGFGNIVADIIGDGDAIEVKTSAPFTLDVNGKAFAVAAGAQRFSLNA